ncbi:MAG: LuxR C-terminal-related transcriptional regulator [Bacteroidota bacterium]
MRKRLGQYRDQQIGLRKTIASQEQEWHRLMEKAPLGIAFVDKQRSITYLNDTMKDWLKINVNTKDHQLIQLDSINGNSRICFDQDNIARVLAGQKVSFKRKIYTDTQEPVYFKCTYEPLFRKDGNVEGFFSFIENITEMKKQVQNKLKSKDSEKVKLRYELDYRNRELFIKNMLITEKNNALNKIKDDLEFLRSHTSNEGTEKIRQIVYMIDQSIDKDDRWQSFKVSFERIHPSFFIKLSQDFPSLSQNELKHCAYMRMNLSNKEVASILHISPKSVEMARYRIKKKLNLEADTSLSTFIHAV